MCNIIKKKVGTFFFHQSINRWGRKELYIFIWGLRVRKMGDSNWRKSKKIISFFMMTNNESFNIHFALFFDMIICLFLLEKEKHLEIYFMTTDSESISCFYCLDIVDKRTKVLCTFLGRWLKNGFFNSLIMFVI